MKVLFKKEFCESRKQCMDPLLDLKCASPKNKPDADAHGQNAIQTCLKSMLGSFRSHLFSHIRRQCNSVFHTLIRRARLSFSQKVWMKFVSPNIFSFVIADFSVR